MYGQDPSSQMHSLWPQYNNAIAAQPDTYNQQFPSYAYQNMSSAHPTPMHYHVGHAPQSYGSSFTPSQPNEPGRALLPVTIGSQPPSPSSHSPRSYPSSPHSPASLNSTSSTSSMLGGYPYPHPPPTTQGHLHILPLPQVARPRIRIPQTLEAGHSNSRIEFRVNGVLGICVQDAIRQFVDIDNGEDRVLARIGARTIRLAIHVCISYFASYRRIAY